MRKVVRQARQLSYRGRIFFGCFATVALCLSSCGRKAPIEPKAAQPEEEDAGKDGVRSREGYAAWYDVPATSLAKRRAGQEELTAAHNHLPIGTRVRVTHLENGKSVLVRITDRGITDRKIKIDLCKEAAQELGMVGQGVAKVRMEVVPDEQAGSPPSQ